MSGASFARAWQLQELWWGASENLRRLAVSITAT